MLLFPSYIPTNEKIVRTPDPQSPEIDLVCIQHKYLQEYCVL